MKTERKILEDEKKEDENKELINEIQNAPLAPIIES